MVVKEASDKKRVFTFRQGLLSLLAMNALFTSASTVEAFIEERPLLM